jgi:large subunit ribosomal protein L21
MFAIFQTGGKQYKVSEGDIIYVEKLKNEIGSEIIFEEIMMINTKVGTPYLKGATIKAVVENHGKQKKIRIIKFQSKKHHMKRQGHRQPYTKLLIKNIKE